MVLYRKPPLRWRHSTLTYGYTPTGVCKYIVDKRGEFWYWVDMYEHDSRPYIDREDAMRGAQRHHEERENG